MVGSGRLWKVSGTARIRPKVGGSKLILTQDEWSAPSLVGNLLSVSVVLRKAASLDFSAKRCALNKGHRISWRWQGILEDCL